MKKLETINDYVDHACMIMSTTIQSTLIEGNETNLYRLIDKLVMTAHKPGVVGGMNLHMQVELIEKHSNGQDTLNANNLYHDITTLSAKIILAMAKEKLYDAAHEVYIMLDDFSLTFDSLIPMPKTTDYHSKTVSDTVERLPFDTHDVFEFSMNNLSLYFVKDY